MKGKNAYELGRPRTRNQWGEFFEKLNEEKKLKRNQFSGLENNDSDVDEVIVVEKERKRHRRSNLVESDSSDDDVAFIGETFPVCRNKSDMVKVISLDSDTDEKEREREKEKGKNTDYICRSGEKDLELDPSAGVKTSFVFELVKLCSAHRERVIVFSRLVEPLSLIEQQLMQHLKWSENEEILYMDGKIDAKY
nr:SNF2 domain-containing protein CLASSY 3-like [Ipomoea trifida]